MFYGWAIRALKIFHNFPTSQSFTWTKQAWLPEGAAPQEWPVKGWEALAREMRFGSSVSFISEASYLLQLSLSGKFS